MKSNSIKPKFRYHNNPQNMDCIKETNEAIKNRDF